MSPTIQRRMNKEKRSHAPNNSTSWPKKEDILRIGNTVYEEYGVTSFICDAKTAKIEGNLLLKILKLFGDYAIVDVDEHTWYDEQYDAWGVDTLYRTNLPYSEYMAVKDQHSNPTKQDEENRA